MTHQENDNSFEQVNDLLAQNGWGAILEIIRILVNQTIAIEPPPIVGAGALFAG